MSRQPTPANILADVLTADVATPDRTALRNRLRWDCSQVAPVDRRAVEDAAVDFYPRQRPAHAAERHRHRRAPDRRQAPARPWPVRRLVRHRIQHEHSHGAEPHERRP